VDDLSLDCATCATSLRLPDGAPELVEQARRFFTEHADCVATLDLTGRPLVGWAVPPAAVPEAWG
jgi:hypothetical protein